MIHAAPLALQPARSVRIRDDRARSKKYRATRKSHEDALNAATNALRTEIQQLMLLRALWESKAVLAHHNPEGSLVKLAREYYTMFQYGLQSDDSKDFAGKKRRPLLGYDDKTAAYKEAFAYQALAPDVYTNDGQHGVSAVLDEWRVVTAKYASMHFECGAFAEISGPEGERTVTLNPIAHMRFSRRTVAAMFPHILHNERIVQQLIRKNITYTFTVRFRFSPDGKQIKHFQMEKDFFTVFSKLLDSVDDLALLVQRPQLDVVECTADNGDPTCGASCSTSDLVGGGFMESDDSGGSARVRCTEEPKQMEPKPTKMALDFILEKK